MAKRNPGQRPDDSGTSVPGSPRTQSRLGLAALVLSVLALPAALFPWLGLVISVIVLLVSLVALIIAVRSVHLSRGYPMIAVAVSIVAVALAGVVTNSTAQTLQDCSSTSTDELRQCMEERRDGTT